MLTLAEIKYTTKEREALAMKWALSKFRAVLEDRRVRVKTNNATLLHLTLSALNSRRIVGWIEFFGHFDMQVEHTTGSKNT